MPITKHGYCKGKIASIYYSWAAMKQRCLNTKCKAYPSYGGRGIKVCKRWQKSFINFLHDMGEKPSPKHTLERINNNGSYKPSNCRWATMKEQQRNRRGFGTSKHKGIWFDKTLGKWIAIIRLGLFDTEKEAYGAIKNYDK